MNIRTFVFTWNCESVKTCTHKDIKNSDCKSDKSVRCSYCPKKSCYIATFAKYLVSYVKRNQYDIAFIATQEDPKPGGNLHSDYMKKLFIENGYKLLPNARHRFMGLGKTTYTKKIMRGLRSSVYIKNEFYNTYEPIQVRNHTYNCSSALLRSKGGIAINLTIAGRSILFINCHLPFNSKSLITHKGRRNSFIQKQSNCLNDIYQKFHAQFRENAVILCGDLNYRIGLTEFDSEEYLRDVFTNLTSDKLRIYFQRDELRQQLNLPDRGIYIKYHEGINNRGPVSFYPTCKFYKQKYSEYITSANGTTCDSKKITSRNKTKKIKKKIGNRSKCQLNTPNFDPTKQPSYKNMDKCYKFGKYSQRAPSWCDRILYYTPNDPTEIRIDRTHEGRALDGTMITCTEYNSYDFSQIMAMSDHSAVFGTYNIHLP